MCGYKNGEIGKNHFQDSHNGKAEKMTLDEIAKQLGTSKTNLTRVLSIERNLTDSMKELLDTGVITKTLATDTISSLSEEDIIETNIRQRGIGNPNPVKLGRCIKELERIYGIEHGGDRKSNPKVSEMNQENIADMIGISVDTLNNYKKLTN